MFKAAFAMDGNQRSSAQHVGIDYDPLLVRKFSGFGSLIDSLNGSTNNAVQSIGSMLFSPKRTGDSDSPYECLEVYCHDSGVSVAIDFSTTQIDIRIRYGDDHEILISDVLAQNGKALGLPNEELKDLVNALVAHENLVAYARLVDDEFSSANGRRSFLVGRVVSKVRFVSNPNYVDCYAPPHVDYGDLTVMSAANDPALYTFINRREPNGEFVRDGRVAIDSGDLQLYCATSTHHSRPFVDPGQQLHRIAAITGFNPR